MDIIGQTVNIKDKSLLQVFYPTFQIKETVLFDNDNDVIYIGPPKKDTVEFLKNNTRRFINTVGKYDLDLDIKEILTRFVYEKWKKEPKDEVLEVLNNMTDEDFYNYIKTYWVLGKSSIDSNSVTIYDLYKVFGKSRTDAVKTYFTLLEYYSPQVIESSLITFIDKVVNYNDVYASGHYMKLLKDFRDKHLNKIKPVLNKYRMMEDDKQTKVLWLLMSF